MLKPKSKCVTQEINLSRNRETAHQNTNKKEKNDRVGQNPFAKIEKWDPKAYLDLGRLGLLLHLLLLGDLGGLGLSRRTLLRDRHCVAN